MVEIRLEFPYDSRLSKNYKQQCGKYGRGEMFKRLRDSFVLYVRAYAKELEGCKRIKLHLNVYRPDQRTDAQNYVEDFCDIVQDAIGVNDRHFETSSKPIDGERPRFELILKGYKR